MSVSFDITNTGFIPLRDAGARLELGYLIIEKNGVEKPLVIQSEGFRLVDGGKAEFGRGFTHSLWQHHDLGVDERFTISPRDVIPDSFISIRGPDVSITRADIAIAVDYKPWLIPIVRTKAFRFITFINGGQIEWRSWPLNATVPWFRSNPPQRP